MDKRIILFGEYFDVLVPGVLENLQTLKNLYFGIQFNRETQLAPSTRNTFPIKKKYIVIYPKVSVR